MIFGVHIASGIKPKFVIVVIIFELDINKCLITERTCDKLWDVVH